MTDLTLEDGKGQLTAEVDGRELLIRYDWSDARIMRVNYVGVPSELGGRGLGTDLVAALVEKARQEDFKLKPVCSFAAAQLNRHPEWHDVLA